MPLQLGTRFFLLIALASLSSPLCKRATDGFSVAKIRGNLPFSSTVQESIPLEGQTFSYLGRGAQVFSFVSQDGSLVLKIFSQHAGRHLLEPLIPFLPARIGERIFSTVEKRRFHLQSSLVSYELAYQLMPEETGLLSLHLGKTRPPVPVTLIDKIGIKHEIDLSQFFFVLQQRAQHVYPSLLQWIETGETERAKEAISSLVTLLQTRCQKGLSDKDPNLKTNFGFIGSRAIQFDPGRYRKDPSKADPESYRVDLIRHTDRIKTYLQQFSPELAQYLSEEVEKNRR